MRTVTPPLVGIDTLILAGGFGTRLRSALPDRQKVLADVGGRPFLGKLIDFYSAAGSSRIVLALGYRSDDVARFIACRQDASELIASIEPEPRGTGGALRHALHWLRTDTVLVANGDSFADVDLLALVNLHRSRRSPITIALAHVTDVTSYGQVTFDQDGTVDRFLEKPAVESGPREGFINAGICLVDRHVIATIPTDRPVSLEREVFPQWVGRGMVALARPVSFIDIGTPESWAAAEQFFAAIEQGRTVP
jgi:NDP-sugar pyrophosphorylase family protein